MNFRREIVDPYKLLKALEPAIKDPKNILTKNTDCKLTNTKTREALTALIISGVMNKVYEDKDISWEICKNDLREDSLDGYLKVTTKQGEDYIELEQTMLTEEEISVKTTQQTPLSQMIIDKIEKKHNKNYSDIEDVVLVIFLDMKGHSIIKEIKKYLKENKQFGFYILVLLNMENDKYIYTVVDLDPEREGHSEYKFEIAEDFNSYSVRLD